MADPRSLSPQEWMTHIRKGERYREIYGKSKHWKKWWKFYRGEFGSQELMPVNLFFSFARSIVPRIYFRNPQVSVIPLRPGYYLQAKILERLDNRLIRETGCKNELRAIGLDAFLFGTGILKFGYDSEFGYDPESAKLVEGGYETGSGEVGPDEPPPVDFAAIPPQHLPAKERIEYNFNVQSGWPWVQRISPASFVVPWGTARLEFAPWCAHSVVRHIDDVKADPKYENTDELSPTLREVPNPFEDKDDGYAIDGSGLYAEDTSVDEYVKLWEIYDAKTSKIYVIADGYDKFLRVDDFPLLEMGYPFKALTFNTDNDHFWGIPDSVNLEPLQLELNGIRTQSKFHRILSKVKFLYRKNAIKQEELMKLLSNAELGIGIEVDGDLDSAVRVLSGHIPPDLTRASREIREDMREILGFSRNQLGEFDASSRRTATEANIVQQASAIRIDERRDAMADVLLYAVQVFNWYIFHNWNEQRVEQIVGPDGIRYWTSFIGENLRGEYGYRIDPDNTLPVTAETRRAQAMQLAQMFANDPEVNSLELKRHLFTQFEGLDPEVLLTPGMTYEQSLQNVMPVDRLAISIAERLAMQARGMQSNGQQPPDDGTSLAQALMGGA